MRRSFLRELASSGLPASPPPGFDPSPVTEADLALLPEAARRYARFMGVVGRPRDWSFRLGLEGRFRRSRTDPWMRCEAWQFNTRAPLARVFHIRMRLFGVVPVLARDTYVDGRGRMLVRVLDRLTVADGRGDAFDIGELVTWLDDSVAIAPSMLFAPDVRWTDGDARSFGLELTDRGRTVRARVHVDDDGAPVDVETTDRFLSDPRDPARATRCRWTTPFGAWQDAGGRRLPAQGRAIWHPEGEEPLPYVELTFRADTLAFDVAPGA